MSLSIGSPIRASGISRSAFAGRHCAGVVTICLPPHEAMRVELVPVDVRAEWVLVVDDDEDAREVAVEGLRSEGYGLNEPLRAAGHHVRT